MTETTTHGAAPVADFDRGTITRTVRVAAPPTTVWKALTTPDHVATWWGHPMDFPDGIRPGSVGMFGWEHGDFAVRIDRMDEPVAYQLSWGFADDMGEDKVTQILFELTAEGDGTLVTMTETGFDRNPDLTERRAIMDDHVKGWVVVLDGLASYSPGLPA